MSAPRRQLSGSAKRQRARTKKLAELRLLAEELGVVIVDPRNSQPASDNGAAAFAQIGPAPLDDPATALSWVRKIQLRALELAVADPELPLAAKLRTVKDLAFTAGASHNRSELEHRLGELELELGLVKQRQPAVEMTPTAGLKRPPTARGGDRARRPRPVETPPPAPLRDSDDDPKERK
jgi:hypothetical protein